MKRQILMARENPKGHKLEDLLKKLRFELTLKTLRLVGDPHPLSKTIMARNKMILMQLERCQSLQETNMAECEAFFSRPSSATEPRLGVKDNIKDIKKSINLFKNGRFDILAERFGEMGDEMDQLGLTDEAFVTDFGQEFIDWMRG